MDVRKFPAVDDRVETGPVQFGDDWPGLFIRGDDAFAYAMALQHQLIHSQVYDLDRSTVKDLFHLLTSSNVNSAMADRMLVEVEDVDKLKNAFSLSKHPFVAVPAGDCNTGPCSSCGRKATAAVHQLGDTQNAI